MTQKPISQSNSKYMPQLDALRAIAVVSVLIHHYNPDSRLGQLNLGPLGVRLFFILSGFLVTVILLRQKEKLANSSQSNQWKPILSIFFMRRLLRLVPACYLTILISYVLAKLSGGFYVHPFWHFAYLSNIYFSFQNWDALTAHLWTVAFDAQFYLIWPFIILFLSPKTILKIIGCFIILSPLFRVGALLLFPSLNFAYIFPLACLDSLGLGCLLGYCQYYQNDLTHKITKYLFLVAFWVGMPYFIIFRITGILYFEKAYLYELFGILSNIFLTYVIYKASKGFKGYVGKILEWSPLIYLGQISYGIYLYHLIAKAGVIKIAQILNVPFSPSSLLSFCVFSGLTVILAALSWHFFEQPINRLKNKFSYTPTQPPART